MSSKIHRKVCRSIRQAEKEAAILKFLANYDVKDFIPTVIEEYQDPNPLALITGLVDGSLVAESSVNRDLMRDIGLRMQRVHHIRGYSLFGFLDEKLEIKQSFAGFADFVTNQIQKWRDWHSINGNDLYLRMYAEWLLEECTKFAEFFRLCKPCFCHGDFDLKNMLLTPSGLIICLLDWEHSGAYCLAWELRKLSRFFYQTNGLWEAFLEGYFKMIPCDQQVLRDAVRYLEAADLLGHLRWCIRHKAVAEYARTQYRMRSFVKGRR